MPVTVFGPPNGNPSPQTIASLKNENRRANARLMAAAPDLLAALRCLILEVERHCPPEPNTPHAAPLEAARAAIAKATTTTDA